MTSERIKTIPPHSAATPDQSAKRDAHGRRIIDLWRESDAINAMIAANPGKYPWQYFNMFLDGELWEYWERSKQAKRKKT